jgi:hypothetical protein
MREGKLLDGGGELMEDTEGRRRGLEGRVLLLGIGYVPALVWRTMGGLSGHSRSFPAEDAGRFAYQKETRARFSAKRKRREVYGVVQGATRVD